jgi:hypothetical protein
MQVKSPPRTKLEELKAAAAEAARADYDAARYTSKLEKLKASYKAARDAYWAELKKTQEEKQND